MHGVPALQRSVAYAMPLCTGFRFKFAKIKQMEIPPRSAEQARSVL